MTKKIIGYLLLIVGLFMLFKMVRVSSFGFWRVGRFSSSAIILVLLIVSAIAAFVSYNKFTFGCLMTSLFLLIISLLLGTELYLEYSSLSDILLVLAPVIIGVGLVIKGKIEDVQKGTE